MSKILEIDWTSVFKDSRDPRSLELAETEMRIQINYSKHLIRQNRKTTPEFEVCQELYRKAYDAYVMLGGDRTNFPKRIR